MLQFSGPRVVLGDREDSHNIEKLSVEIVNNTGIIISVCQWVVNLIFTVASNFECLKRD